MSLCDQCIGACCREPWIESPADFVFPKVTEECLAVRGREGPCPKLTPDGRCSIYEMRPLLCRIGQAGDWWCIEARRNHGLA